MRTGDILYCQLCEDRISSSGFEIYKNFYQCPQSKNAKRFLELIYPYSLFKVQDGKVFLRSREIPRGYTKAIKSCIKDALLSGKNHGTHVYSGEPEITVYPSQSKVVWRFERDEKKYYKEAGLVKHQIEGGDLLGYCLDESCAKKFDYHCPACGVELIHVKARR